MCICLYVYISKPLLIRTCRLAVISDVICLRAMMSSLSVSLLCEIASFVANVIMFAFVVVVQPIIGRLGRFLSMATP